ncbi:deoxycytidyl transferase, partial [Tulasnella sp. 417]
ATILPSQVHLIQQRSRKNISYSSAQYISFYNCIWLILNDVIIGTTIGLLLLENSNVLGIKLAALARTYTVDMLRETLMWLDNWPVGLKLNTELSHAFCTLFVGLTDLWSNALETIAPQFPILISLLGMSGRLGFTMIFRMLSVFGSLWRLFRGKRRNVLRNRTDSWDYDLDQLLLGTILFTLLAFLFPTVLVYYALFALARILIILIHASLETCLAFLNHFPLFAMLLRLKDAARLPEYLEALASYSFSTQKKPTSVGAKRKRTASPEPDSDVNPALFTGPRPPKETVSSKNENYVYGAANFGGFGEYMFRKRAKLQIQNDQLADEDDKTKKPQIFKGVAIYVNGFTDPPLQDLREMMTAYGGVFHAYLDRKSMVTHVIASQLTPAKILEYQRAKFKVVKPEWIVKSVEAGVLQRWQDYVLQPGAVGTVAALGQGTDFSGAGSRMAAVDVDQSSIRAPQKTLTEAFASRRPSQAANSKPPTGQKRSEAARDPLDLTSPERRAPDLPDTTPGPSKSSPQRVLRGTLGGSDGPASPTRQVTDPQAFESDPGGSDDQEPIEQPSYAMYDSNPVAAKLMESTEWRRQHTSANPQAFTESYFQNSRLHHLSAWKSELRQLVADAREQAEKAEELATQRGDSNPTMDVDVTSMQGARLPRMLVPKRDKGKGKENDRVIMHVDFDSFFVAAGLVDRPQLKGKPVVVCHSGAGKVSTSEIASASYEARTFGIKNGMSLGQARQLCPHVQPIPYEFEKYKAFSLKFYTILMAFADDLQAVSVDEAILDVSERVAQLKMASDDPGDRDFAKELAEQIRDKVRENTGCEVSVGISHNIMLARMATRHAKPAKSYHLLSGDVPSHLAPLEIKAIHGVGRSIRDKISDKYGAETLGELLDKSKDSLQRLLGEKTGDKIWKAVRGIDDTPLESDKPRKSVSAEVNYGIRFENNEQAEAFVMNLGTEVSKRLKAVSKRGRFMTLKIMVRKADAPLEAAKFLGHGSVDCYNKSAAISDGRGGPTDDPVQIGEESWRLLKGFNFDPKELRGIGIQIQ